MKSKKIGKSETKMNNGLCVLQLESLKRYIEISHEKNNGLLNTDIPALEYAISQLKNIELIKTIDLGSEIQLEVKHNNKTFSGVISEGGLK